MVTKLFLRPHCLPLSRIIFSKIPLLPKKFPILSLFTTAAAAQPQLPDRTNSSYVYGPSLLKGTNPLILQSQPSIAKTLNHRQQQGDDEEENGGNGDLFDEESFSRVFEITALRVPAKDCFALESRLRGHLLNWPRIRNIGRVPGDEVEDEIADLLANPSRKPGDDENALASLDRRIHGKSDGDGEALSPVLYREKLAKTFDSRGYVKFRNLARMSRPNQRKKRSGEEGDGDEGKKRLRRGEFSVLEVMEDEEEGEDLVGLLGDEFEGRKKWRGSTRLLLLDERYAGKGLEELPEAIKVVVLISILVFLSKSIH